MDQVRSDLHELADLMVDDQPAAAIYLEAGANLLGAHPEADYLRAVADRLRRGPCRVVLMNPRVPTRWHITHDGAQCDVIEGPTGLWHLDALPGTTPWQAARDAIDAVVDDIEQRTGDVHVYASTAYALSAYLGNRIGNLPGIRPHYWQAGGDRTWSNYGPGDGHSHAPSPLLACETERGGAESSVALLVSVTHTVQWSEVEPGLAQADAPDATVLRLGMPPSQTAIVDRSMVERAARDLRDAVDEVLRRPGLKALHLFYSGPGALLMRAAEKWHLPTADLVVHERGVRAGTGDHAPAKHVFRPAITFRGGRAELLNAME